MPEENLENINLGGVKPEKPEQKAGGIEKPEQLFDREGISSDIDEAKKERMKEILGKLSEGKTANSGRQEAAPSFQKEDEIVAGFLKEAYFGKKDINKVINEVKRTGNPYIIDAFHDQLMEELKKFKENK